MDEDRSVMQATAESTTRRQTLTGSRRSRSRQASSTIAARLRPRSFVVINTDFTRLWLGQAASGIGDQLALTTMVLWIGTTLLRGEQRAPAVVAGLIVAESITVLLVAPVAGVFVDRWDRRRIMLAADLARAGLYAGIVLVAAVGARHVQLCIVLLYAVTVGSAAAARFFIPARAAYVADIVPGAAARARASGIGQATDAAAIIAGPPLAAPLLLSAGPQWALALNAASFLFSYAVVRRVHAPALARLTVDESGGCTLGLWREFVAGVRFIARNRVLLVLTVSVVVSTLGAGALSALGVFFTMRNLHATASFYGFLGLSFGIGIAAGALAGGALAARYGPARVLSGGLLSAGLLVTVYAKQGSPWPALAVLALIGVPVGVLNTLIGSMQLAVTPRELLGRVNATINPIQQVAGLVSAAVASWLVSSALPGLNADIGGVHFGPIDTVYFASAVPILAGGLYAFLALRREHHGLS
ncbi:MFS family permease [Catenulispora sp. MAP12-49]|uniref:MFS transporter n=1 Tax=Catenulispora sp. MAP12-49 TaxID=3156302 RepID=UPI003514619C